MRIVMTLRQQRSKAVLWTFVLVSLFGLTACGVPDTKMQCGASETCVMLAEQASDPAATHMPGPTSAISLPDKAITSDATTPDGALWVAFDEYDAVGGAPPSSQHHGLYRSLDGQLSHWEVPGTIRVLAAAPDGSLYIGAGRGVLRYADGRLETLIDVERGQASFARGFVPFEIAFSPDGEVWVGGVYSLARFDGEAWTQYEVNVRRLLAAADGSVWGQGWDGRAGSDCCYVHVTGDTWVTYTHSALLRVSLEQTADVRRLRN